MNMVPTQNFTPEYEVTGLEKTENSNPKLAGLMKVWENKQKTAGKVGTFGLMAVGLSACGGSSDDDGDVVDPIGEIFNLTIGDDNITGTDFADTFNALLASAQGSLTGVLGLQTLGDTDIIDGGDGIDTLNAVLNGTGLAIFDYAAPFITNVEIYNLTSRNDAGGLDLNNSSGYTQLWNINSAGDLTLVNVEEAAALGLQGTEGGTTYSVEYTSSAAADIVEQLVIANDVGGSTLSGQFTTLNVTDASGDTGIEDLNLQVSNGVRMVLDGSVANIENLDIDGSGDLVLSADGDFVNLVTLNSAGYAGDLILDVSGSADLTSVITAAGDDFVTIQDINADGGLSVAMGAGDDTLGLLDLTPVPANLSQIQILQGEEISSWDFTGGVSGVETLAVLTDVYLANNVISGPVVPADATLDLDGFDGDLTTITFDAFYGNGNVFALQNAPETLDIEAGMFDSVELDTGNVVNLTVSVNGDDADKGFADGDLGELDIDELSGGSLETLTLINTSAVDPSNSDAGDIYLDINSDTDHDVSALQSISVDASDDADVELDADDADADMSALTTIDVVAGADADLEMDGVPSQFQQQEFEITFDSVSGGANFELVLDIPDEANDVTVVRADLADLDTLNQAFVGSGYVAVAIDNNGGDNDIGFTVEKLGAPGQAVPIAITSFSSTNLVNAAVTTDVTQAGIAAASYLGLEEVVVTGGETADVNLDDVHGSFTLDVTASGLEASTDADVDVDNTNVTSINVTANDAVGYTVDGGGVVNGYEDTETGHADIDISDDGNTSGFGNPLLTSLTVTSATAEIDLDGDLSSMTTIDLTGVTTEFDVNATLADFEPAAGDYVTYLIGTTASDWEEGDSSIDMADAREAVTFTEADFGTVVLNGFTAGDDPATGDRIDLSQLGFTNNGQVTFEVGDYNAGTGEWTLDAAGDDVRIVDLAGGPAMSGEIIVDGGAYTGTGQDLSDDLSQYNMVYA